MARSLRPRVTLGVVDVQVQVPGGPGRQRGLYGLDPHLRRRLGLRGRGHADGEECVARLDGSERAVAGPGTAKLAAEVADLHREEREAVAASGGVHERVDGVAGQVAEGQPSPTLGTGCSRSMCRWLSPGIVIGWMVALTRPRARSGASSSSARAGSPAWIASTITNDLPPISAGTCGLCGGPRKRPTVVSSWGRSPWVRSPERAVPRSRGPPGQPLTISPALARRPGRIRPCHRDAERGWPVTSSFPSSSRRKAHTLIRRSPAPRPT